MKQKKPWIKTFSSSQNTYTTRGLQLEEKRQTQKHSPVIDTLLWLFAFLCIGSLLWGLLTYDIHQETPSHDSIEEQETTSEQTDR